MTNSELGLRKPFSRVQLRKDWVIYDQGRQINPDFKLFTNGFHAVHADFFLSEGRASGITDEVYRVFRRTLFTEVFSR